LQFDEELRRAAESDSINLKVTNPGHISHFSTGRGNSFPVHEGEPAINGKGQLNLDMEMAKMTRNNLLYEASAKLLAKKFKALRSAIEAGRR
jgi:flagellar basal-body rod protein FlgB